MPNVCECEPRQQACRNRRRTKHFEVFSLQSGSPAPSNTEAISYHAGELLPLLEARGSGEEGRGGCPARISSTENKPSHAHKSDLCQRDPDRSPLFRKMHSVRQPNGNVLPIARLPVCPGDLLCTSSMHHHLERVVVDEGWLPDEHLVEQNSQGPPVYPLPVALVEEHLRGDILRSTAESVRLESHNLRVSLFKVGFDDGRRSGTAKD